MGIFRKKKDPTPEPDSAPGPDPAEVITNAKPGDTVHISLRGPHTPEELAEIKQTHEAEYPKVKFEFTWDDDVIAAEVDHG